MGAWSAGSRPRRRHYEGRASFVHWGKNEKEAEREIVRRTFTRSEREVFVVCEKEGRSEKKDETIMLNEGQKGR